MRGRGLPGWGRGVDGADLEETEAEPGEPVDRLAVLVEAGGQADAVGKAQAHDVDRACGFGLARRQQLADEVESLEREVVGVFGVERKQQRADEFVEHRRIVAIRRRGREARAAR
jgi:hypothetical protein